MIHVNIEVTLLLRRYLACHAWLQSDGLQKTKERTAMTSRDRIITAIHCGKADRVPVSPFGLGKLDRESDIARELIARTDPFIPVGIGAGIFEGALVTREVYREQGDTVTVIHTPKGPLTQRFRRTAITGYNVEFFCKNSEDIEKYLSIPYEPVKPNLGNFFRVVDDTGDAGLVLADVPNAICLPATILSPADFCLLWADDPKLMQHIVEIAAERLNAFIEAACEQGVDAFRIIGGEYATTQLGPEGFHQLVVPYDTGLVEIMHRYGAVAYYHNHGCVDAYLEDFVRIGIDALDPLEAPPYGDIDLTQAKRRVAGKLCLVGNIDDMEILEKEDPEVVREIGRTRIEAAGPDGFILGGTASGTYTEKAARNFMVLVEVSEQYA